MSEDDPNKQLIPVEHEARSGIVGASLEKAQGSLIIKPVLRILLGLNEIGLTKALTLLLSQHLSGRYAIKIVEIDTAEELVASAEQQSYDLAIVLLNNLLCLSGNHWPRRMDAVIAAVGKAKTLCKKPIIATSGFGFEEYIVAVRQAGVNAFFPIPFSFEDFEKALDESLRLIEQDSEERHE